ncbi:DEKNAAC100336 [Brettanomyces naardenensis]|uniref:Phospholipid-transporting ATPase n=1 Tax=Brettanomyces naardenensis TaxID=13370 RepID=A0A448YEF3_BRENA|nr:DEKNAAC100336 [Brettanomyces naardenensis]
MPSSKGHRHARSPFDDRYRFETDTNRSRLDPIHSDVASENSSNEELNFGTLGNLPSDIRPSQPHYNSSNTSNSSPHQHSSDSPYDSSESGDSDSLGRTPDVPQSSSFSSINLKQAHVNFSEQQVPNSSDSVNVTSSSTNSNVTAVTNGSNGKPKRSRTLFRRDRWGTQRTKNGRPVRHGTLIRRRTLKRAIDRIPQARRLFSGSLYGGEEDEEDGMGDTNDEKDRSKEKRDVFWNMPLPESQLDEDGNPPEYPRNKIRTTKYTPLTFLPKNLFNQFKNVANIYFLTMIVMGFFNIFGVPNPAVSAVPLIVIVCITAFKDALEDSRRTGSDMKINNLVTHVVRGLDNPNFNGENVSQWRKFKKLNTRILLKLIRRIKNEPEIDPLAYDDGGPRKSLDSFDYHRGSLDLNRGVTESTDSIAAADPFGDSQVYDSRDDLAGTTVAEDNYSPQIKPFVAPRDSLLDKSSISHPVFKRDYWKNIHVGDVVKIKNNDQVPVDIVILSTSDSDGGCYVETKNLDGETNLKVKQALKCSSSYIRNVNDLTRCKFWLESEGPKANLYSYEGNLNYYVNGDQGGEVSNEPVTINNLLLRGCSLRNTNWVVGIVAFTGPDTKIMLNAGITPTKKSRISKELNWQVVLNFFLLFLLCFVSGLINGIYYGRDDNSRIYFEYGSLAGSPVTNGIVGFFVSLILYQSLVPISLYISIEIIKTAQAFFIYSDVKMYNEKLDYPCVPKSWSISDDLGQIEYIFSDKTGTLTQNVMEFKKCTINGKIYGRAYTEAYADIRRRQGIDVEEESAREKREIAEDKVDMMGILQDLNRKDVDENELDKDLTFVSKTYAQDLRGSNGSVQKEAAENFALALALCHSVLTEKSETEPYKLEFRAQSPDEAALVSTARDVGFSFIDRTKTGIILDVQGLEREYQILNMLEFNSTRKRMSVIIKVPAADPSDPPTALLICKGADSVIFSRLSSKNPSDILEKTAIHLEQFATEGLRTLCIAKRELAWDEYEEWNKRHNVAASSLVDREAKMEEVASEIEQQLFLLGGTAIEDRLQDGVPESIQLLARAGIKLWVLTGDKVETAINIGFSCNLLTNSMNLLVVKTSGEDIQKLFEPEEWDRIEGDKGAVVSGLLGKYLSDNFRLDGTPEELAKEKHIHRPPSGNYGIVIDGAALKLALSDEIKIKFLLLCKQCKAVLCCRVSPAQKAAVVKLVKESLEVMTLAIGDGSNDVAMIQAANVGVGIAGEEGTQAAMSSDYAIAQFRYLTRLVLVHGRWSYKRLAEMIPSFFYKNVVFTLALFWYGIYDNFDGTYLFEYTYLMFYNLAFTSLPVIFLGILDQDVDDKVSLLVPQLYRSGILRKEWNVRKFVWYMFDGFYQSVVCFFLPFFLYYKGFFVDSNGLPLDHRFLMGALVSTIAIMSCDFYVLAHQKRWDWLSVFIASLSVIIVFGWTGIWSSSLESGAFYKSADELYGSTAFWACLFTGFLMCIMPRFSYDFVSTVIKPKDIDIIRERVSMGVYDQYPEGYDPTDPNRPAINKTAANDSYYESYSGESPSYPSPAHQNLHKSVFSRMFSKKPSTRPPPSASVDTLATEEIELDFTSPQGQILKHFESHNNNNHRLESERNVSLERTRSSLEYSRTGEGNGRGTSMELVRTSLDLPGLTTANSLIENLERGSKKTKRKKIFM